MPNSGLSVDTLAPELMMMVVVGAGVPSISPCVVQCSPAFSVKLTVVSPGLVTCTLVPSSKATRFRSTYLKGSPGVPAANRSSPIGMENEVAASTACFDKISTAPPRIPGALTSAPSCAAGSCTCTMVTGPPLETIRSPPSKRTSAELRGMVMQSASVPGVAHCALPPTKVSQPVWEIIVRLSPLDRISLTQGLET